MWIVLRGAQAGRGKETVPIQRFEEWEEDGRPGEEEENHRDTVTIQDLQHH